MGADIQPELYLDEDEMPVYPLVIECAKRWEHNGVTTCRDEVLCARIVEMRLLGIGTRTIAVKLGVSRSTVRAVMSVLEVRGKLGPLKQRLSSKLAIAIELSLDTAIDMLERGKVPANVLPIMCGVFSDKKVQVDGDATARVEITPREQVSLEDFRKWYQSLRPVASVAAVTIDCPSTDITPIPQ